MRFALSGAGDVVPDLRRKLPGRGVWTRLDFATVRQAAAKQVFSRGFRAHADAAPELAEDVDRLLERDALQFLSIVNKAGLVVTGAAKVEAAIRAGTVAALIHAVDGSPDGASKLDRLLRGRFGEVAELGPPNKSVPLGPIGFGIGKDKCDTCSAQRGRGQCGLSREGRAFEAISGGRRDADGGLDRREPERRARQNAGMNDCEPGPLEKRMSETNNSGDKTLSASPPKATLHLKRPVEQGTVRQSFSHGRSKAVVVEKVKRRVLGPGEAPARERRRPRSLPRQPPPPRRPAARPSPPRSRRRRPASYCAR